jgi:hypothetical protein
LTFFIKTHFSFFNTFFVYNLYNFSAANYENSLTNGKKAAQILFRNSEFYSSGHVFTWLSLLLHYKWICGCFLNGTNPITLNHTPCFLCSQDQQCYTTNWQWTVKLITSRGKVKIAVKQKTHIKFNWKEIKERVSN